MTRMWAIGLSLGLTLWLLLADSQATADSLYRCVTETEGIIYTDNPAQLEQCTPITASGAVTSLATVSSDGPPTPRPPDPPPMTQPPPEPAVVISPQGSAPQTTDVPPPSAGPTTPPCPVGVNPLNPLSAPPCPPAETVPAATITPPLGPDTPSNSPPQP